jgi:hypothetical protein
MFRKIFGFRRSQYRINRQIIKRLRFERLENRRLLTCPPTGGMPIDVTHTGDDVYEGSLRAAIDCANEYTDTNKHH